MVIRKKICIFAAKLNSKMDYKDLVELEDAKKAWYEKFDTLKKLVEECGNTATPFPRIGTRVRIDSCTYKSMQLLFISVSHRWILDDIILNFIDDDNPDAVKPIIVARAFEAKAFGDIQDVEELFDFIIKLFDMNGNKIIKNMAKVDSYKKGTMVSAKKFTGEEFLGLYQHSYDDGSHCVSDGNKNWCCHHKDVKLANEEESKIIQETIIKPQREAEKRKKLEAEAEAARAAAESEFTVEDFEEAAEPTQEELNEAMNSSETVEEE